MWLLLTLPFRRSTHISPIAMRPTIPAFIAAVWMAFVFYFNYSQQAVSIDAANSANVTSCAASLSTVTAIQYAAYNCRAVDLLPILPTLRAAFNVSLEFYETDGRVTNRYSITQVRPGSGVLRSIVSCGSCSLLPVPGANVLHPKLHGRMLWALILC